MHFQASILFLSGATYVLAFPGMAGMMPHVKGSTRHAYFDRRVVEDPAYIVNLTAANVRVPDEAHPYMPPGPTDQRGPCPGINVLANHGYLPRHGIVTHDQVVNGTFEGFNMGLDLGNFFSLISMWHTGDLRTGLYSIGGPDARTSPDNKTVGWGAVNMVGYAGGLDYHNAGIEGDGSSSRLDLWNGDDKTMNMGLWEKVTKIAEEKYDGLYTYTCMEEFTKDRYLTDIATNPTYYFIPPTGFLDMGAKVLYALFFANGTWGDGGVPSFPVVSSIIGAELQDDGSYKRVPERIPDNFYRRGPPLSVADIVNSITHTYFTQNMTFGANQGRPNSFLPLDVPRPTTAQGMACLLKDSIHANPPPLAPGVRSVAYDREALLEQFATEIMDPLFSYYNCSAYDPALGAKYAAVSKHAIYGDPAIDFEKVL